jgi:mRNA interferase MazF
MGQILICDFSSGFVEPEMVKVRPVVVISPKPRKSIHSLCTVVPLSTTRAFGDRKISPFLSF